MGGILNIPWISQFDAARVERAGPTACYRACRAMAAAAGFTLPESTEQRIQVATGEDADGRVITTPESTRVAVETLLSFTAHGVPMVPVVAGLNYKRGSLNRDGVTDHYVLVIGWGITRDFPTVYLALDPGRALEPGATHNTELAVDGGQLVRTWPRRGRWLEMQVSMLVTPLDARTARE